MEGLRSPRQQASTVVQGGLSGWRSSLFRLKDDKSWGDGRNRPLEFMRASVLSLLWRRLRVRAFRDRELEHEFRTVFRAAGVRFFDVAAALTGLAFLAFFIIYAVSGTNGILAEPQ